ncbi:MAG: 3-deoxy-manno-octulosonate cytidylyltransferase [Chthoniobacter sp.]|uniref:3-deoxy-manno-octulosonate cytidylyltransferase n=1 Tax=Chthoniobacter sp. TaxID=2510640 RepID=UPI0032A3EE2E
MPKVAVVIPSRYASTRLPAKPLHPIAGKPLVQHVWERCARAKGVDKVIVATDDMRIAEAAFAFGAEVAMTSPKHRSGTDRVAEVAKKLAGFTHIINVQGDEPLVDPTVLSKLAAAMAKDRRIEMITSASVFTPEDDLTNPNMVKVVLDRESNGLYFSRSVIPYVRGDGLRPQFYRHQGIYGYTTKFLLQFVKWKPGILEQAESLEQLRALENGTKIRVILAKHAAVSVDTPEDVTAVERLLARN